MILFTYQATASVYIGANSGWTWGIGGTILLLAVLYALLRNNEQFQELREGLDRRWRQTVYRGMLFYKRVAQLAIDVAQPPLHLTRRVTQPTLRHASLFVLIVTACFLPYLLRMLLPRAGAFFQIFWSLAIFGTCLAIALVHFLVEKELDAVANGLLSRERKKHSEVPLARYLSLEDMVGLTTLGIACVGMMLSFAFLAQGIYEVGLQQWYSVKGTAASPPLTAWIAYAVGSVFRALDIFDTLSTFSTTTAAQIPPIYHKGFITSGLVFVFKAIFDILLIAKIRDWWSKRSLAQEAIAALAHQETRDKAEETLRRCRKSAIAPLLDTYRNTYHSDVKVSALKLLQELSYPRREELFLEALNSNEEDVRKEAARQLGQQETDISIQGLARALDDSSTDVREAATKALAVGERERIPTVTPLLLKALKDSAGRVRAQAAQVLGRLAPAEAKEPLCEALQDKEGDVRKEVVAAVARFGEEIFTRLVPMQDDPNAQVRMAIVKAVAERMEQEPEKAMEFLLKATNDDEPEIRTTAISELRWGQHSQAILQLGIILQLDNNYEVRREAAAVLGDLANQEAIEPLFSALQDQHYLVRCRAIESLGDLRARNAVDQLLALLDDSDRDVRRQVAVTMGELGVRTETVIDALTTALRDPKNDEIVRKACVEALSELTDAQAPAIADAIDDPHPEVRLEAINTLSPPMPDTFVPLVLARLQDPNETRDVRLAAIKTIGFYDADNWHHIADHVSPLLPLLLEDDDIEMRKETLSAIGMIGFPGAHAYLLPQLRDSESDVRREAAQALNFVPMTDGEGSGSTEVLTGLFEALGDVNFRVRMAAAEAIGEHAERYDIPQSVTPLGRALRDDEQEVRKQAALALAQVDAPDALKALLQAISDPEPQVRTAAAEALGVRSSEREPQDTQVQQAFAALRDAMTDKHDDVRQAATEALGNIGTAESVALLIQALRKDRYDWVRFHAVMSLSSMDDELVQPAIPALQQSMADDQDEWVRAYAAEHLGSLKDASSIPALIQCLREDKNAWPRQHAAVALTAFNDSQANEALAAALLQERHPEVRTAIVDAFEELRLATHVDALQEAHTREEDPKLRKRILDLWFDLLLQDL